MNELRKCCAKCREWKPFDEFYRRPNGKFGRTARCKRCTGKDQARYRATPGYKLSHERSMRRFRGTDKGRESREMDKLRLRIRAARLRRAIIAGQGEV